MRCVLRATNASKCVRGLGAGGAYSAPQIPCLDLGRERSDEDREGKRLGRGMERRGGRKGSGRGESGRKEREKGSFIGRRKNGKVKPLSSKNSGYGFALLPSTTAFFLIIYFPPHQTFYQHDAPAEDQQVRLLQDLVVFEL